MAKSRLRRVVEANMVLSQKQGQVQDLMKKLQQVKNETQNIPHLGITPGIVIRAELISSKKFAEGHVDDPVISFSSAQKPSPKRNYACAAGSNGDKHTAATFSSEDHPLLLPHSSINPKKMPSHHKEEFEDLQGNIIQLEASECVLSSCKTKFSKYFCG